MVEGERFDMTEEKNDAREESLKEVAGGDKITTYDENGRQVTYLTPSDVYHVDVLLPGVGYRRMYFRDPEKAEDCYRRGHAKPPVLEKNVFADVEFNDDNYLKYIS